MGHILGRIHKCDSFFGGLNVIALGDLYQLPPVPPGHFVFSGKSQLNTHLWKDLFTMLELEQNMRQKDDIQYGNLLLRIRTSTHTPHCRQSFTF
jgi:hypothetical protein